MGKGPWPRSLILFFFAGFAWALWTTRNKMAIEKKVSKSTTDVVYLALSLMQKWSIKLKEKDQERVANFKGAIMEWLRSFKPNPVLLSDVFEL